MLTYAQYYQVQCKVARDIKDIPQEHLLDINEYFAHICIDFTDRSRLVLDSVSNKSEVIYI